MDWNFRNVSIVVIGDHNLDHDLIGNYSGLMSREKESLAIHSSASDKVYFSGGGAGNIVEVLSAIGVGLIYPVGAWNPTLCDRSMSLYRRYIQLPGIATTVFMADGYSTPAFIKFYMPSGHHIFRANVAADVISEETEKQLCDIIRRLPDVDLVIVADYDEDMRGVLTEKVHQAIYNRFTLPAPVKVGLSRKRIGSLYDYDYLVLNSKELDAYSDNKDKAWQVIELIRNTKAKNVLLTLEDKGCALYTWDSEKKALNTRQIGEESISKEMIGSKPVCAQTDSCGAGDALLALFSACKAKGIGTCPAIRAGNAAARAEVKLLYGARALTLDMVKAEYEELYLQP
jgi:bifunctional ADP-heptose synthase (sugar kinase/adenylyltransferase)